MERWSKKKETVFEISGGAAGATAPPRLAKKKNSKNRERK